MTDKISLDDVINLEKCVQRPPPGTKVRIPIHVLMAMLSIANAVERAGDNGTTVEEEYAKLE